MGVTPQIFQIIKLSFFRGKHVNNQVAKIDQNPTGFGNAFQMIRLHASFLLGFRPDAFRKRPNLPFIFTAANQKIIGECSLFS